MKKELRKQIELLEQKMSKSPNNMKDGGKSFSVPQGKNDTIQNAAEKYAAEIACKKIETNRKLYLKTNYRRTL